MISFYTRYSCDDSSSNIFRIRFGQNDARLRYSSNMILVIGINNK
jgi:hypothetical protein